MGEGLVLSTSPRPGPGPPLVIRFGDGVHCLPRSQVQIEGGPWPGLPHPRHREPLGESQRQAVRWLESLRFGTVVEGGGRELLTVGRQRELEVIGQDLRRAREQGGALRVFTGAYGSGKSHLLEVLKRTALEQGMATCGAVLDKERIAVSRPRRLWAELVAGLHLPPPASEQGLRALAWLLSEAVERETALLKEGLPGPHGFLTPLLRAWKSCREAGRLDRLGPDLLHWFAGGERFHNARLRRRVNRQTGLDPGPLYALKDHRTVWNQLTYLVTGLAFLLKETGTAGGLVVLLDEAEMCVAKRPRDQEPADRALAGLACAALGRRSVQRSALLSVRGGHAATRDFPAFYQTRSHLYLAFGMATDSEGRECLGRILQDVHFSAIGSLDSGQIRELLEKIVVSYKCAFPHFPLGPGFGGALSQLLSSGGRSLRTPRQLVQQALAFLDGARLWEGPVDTYVEAFLESYD